MSIFTIEQSGTLVWGARYKVRSKIDPTIAIQKEKTGFKTEAEAKKAERQLMNEAIRAVAQREGAGATLEEILCDWETKAKLGLTDTRRVQTTTIVDSVQSVRIFLADHLHKPAQFLTRTDILGCLREMELKGYSHSRKRSVLSAINKIYQWAIDCRLLPMHMAIPSKGIEIERNEDKKPLILNEREVRLLLRTALENGHDWYPVWAFAVLTGCRSGELFALLWTDIDWDRKVITVSKSWNGRMKVTKSTKGGYWRDVPINEDLERLLRELHKKTGSTQHVLPRLPLWKRGEQSKPIRAFCKEIGIPEVTFHTLRACFATYLLQNKVSHSVVQKMCGWSEIKVMQRYLRMSGVETEGATATLRLLPQEIPEDKVVPIFGLNSGGKAE